MHRFLLFPAGLFLLQREILLNGSPRHCDGFMSSKVNNTLVCFCRVLSKGLQICKLSYIDKKTE